METTIQKLPFLIDEDRLKAIIHCAVESKIKHLINNSKIEKPVSLKEAAAFLDVSTHSVMKRVKSGEIKPYRLQGERSPYYFYLSEIDKVLRAGVKNTLSHLINQ